ncbi:MAG: 2OG-Fe(II) oxygenase [Opitutaceae bacterium]
MDDLLDALDLITGTGCFHSTGELPFFFPQIRVEGGEELGFPLSSAQARQLIELAEGAPYGQGTETVFDESVRKSWQLDASQLNIESDVWPKFMKKLLKRITKDLGVEGLVNAELYKLLLYGEGGHFKAHRDTEKLDAMFGTLIIKLPSRHEGGTLHIRHGGEAVTVNFSDPQYTYDFQYAALFADCEHEVTPVTSGYRCCLVYNLVLQQGDPEQLNCAVAAQADVLKPYLMSDAYRDVDAPQIVLLEHQYTEANFSLAGLKGHDQARTRALLMAAEAAGYRAYLGLVTLHQEGELDGGDYGYRRGRYWDDDYDEDWDDGEMGEVYSESLTVGNWLDIQGREQGFGDFPIDASQLLSRNEIDADDPIEKEGEGPTGNAGCTMDYWYRRGAVIFWPKERHATMLATSNKLAACKLLEQQASQVGAATNPDFIQLGGALIKVFAGGSEPSGDFAVEQGQALLLRAITEAGSLPLLRAMIQELTMGHFVSCSTEDWCRLLARFEMAELLPIVHCLCEPQAHVPRDLVFALLQGLLKSNPVGLSQVGCRLATKAAQLAPKEVNPWMRSRSQFSTIDEMQILLASSYLVENVSVRQLIRASIWGDGSLKSLRSLVLLALLQASDVQYHSLPNSLFPEIIQQVRVMLEAELARAIVPFKDWSRFSTPEMDRSYPEFAEFLRSATRKEYVYPALKEIRERMKRAIEAAGVDVDCKMVKKGSPHQLVCTKNKASYRHALKLRVEDEARLKQVLELQSQFL